LSGRREIIGYPTRIKNGKNAVERKTAAHFSPTFSKKKETRKLGRKRQKLGRDLNEHKGVTERITNGQSVNCLTD